MNVSALSMLLGATFLMHIFLMGALSRVPPIERLLHPLMWAAWTSLIWLIADSDPNRGIVTLLVAVAGGIGALIGLWREVGALCAWFFRLGRIRQPKTMSRSLGPPIFSVYGADGRPVTRGMGPRSRNMGA